MTRGGIALLDEACQLLRRAPASALLAYYAGSMPFILGFLFFWADMSRGAFAREHVAEAALAVAALYLWMKCWQSVFAARLSAHLAGDPPVPWSVRRIARLVLIQTALQPWGIVLRPVAVLMVLPYAWARAFFENATLFGDGTRDLSATTRRAVAQAKLWPGPNHTALSLLLVFAFFVWLNVAVLIFLVPLALRMFLGIETMYTRSLLSMLNTTWFMTACGLTFLVTNPILKAFYILRCFYGDALTTGDDLRIELKKARPELARAAALVALLFLIGTPAIAAPPPAPTQVEPAQLDRAIGEVLERPEYAWRMPRERVEEEKGWFATLIDDALQGVARVWGKVHEWYLWLKMLLYRLLHLDRIQPPSGGATGAGAIPAILYGLSAIALGLLIFLVIRMWRGRRTPVAQAEAIASVPDLASDEVVADQLPEDGWMRLAREMIERGELRLALRALYLAGLAHLGHREMISIARHKSNRDYERELRRRARSRPELVTAFDENMLVFERAWYGLHEVSDDLLRAFTGNLERIRAC